MKSYVLKNLEQAKEFLWQEALVRAGLDSVHFTVDHIRDIEEELDYAIFLVRGVFSDVSEG